ncbi:hypothetical protein SeMB42_g00147 [Synchytrium endobioticum]|uniref:Cyclin-dependent kinases regulatory subunit n=1 Tax=Synchytrium endobioticum TaxID=286115 RepID=A0A507DFF3_9FUNG|nr:hypothetical protein SeLEV6574_g01092 [Synchytrium endobioticum]TPX54666.1 hypothetical protein SeMB42_g00147 [Synchytrium endobioticum]
MTQQPTNEYDIMLAEDVIEHDDSEEEYAKERLLQYQKETCDVHQRYADFVSEHQDLVDKIYYSQRYYDDDYEYRHVILPKQLYKEIPQHLKGCLLSDAEWRAIGITQSVGWEHYCIHAPEPHIFMFKRQKHFQEKREQLVAEKFVEEPESALLEAAQPEDAAEEDAQIECIARMTAGQGRERSEAPRSHRKRPLSRSASSTSSQDHIQDRDDSAAKISSRRVSSRRSPRLSSGSTMHDVTQQHPELICSSSSGNDEGSSRERRIPH